MVKTPLIILILLSIITHSGAQVDFDKYVTLSSSGIVPEVFVTSTLSKMNSSKGEMNGEMTNKEKEIFFNSIHYSIDELLHSGDVIFGDAVSRYSDEIVSRLLMEEEQLRSKIQVYTLKSNAVNAFSTDQGIILVTTGLIARLKSEAQLAFILSHEISHFKLKHVRKTFEWVNDNKRKSRQIAHYSKYSKEKEFEADNEAILRYNKAGYSLSEINETFNLLTYSHLPFETIEIPFRYLMTSRFKVQNHHIINRDKDIGTINDNFDDSLSTHPNSRKRKDSILIETSKYEEWGDHKFLLDQNLFFEIRDIARFETVRSAIIERDFGYALHAIFVLEKTFPESNYLRRMKAQVWIALLLTIKKHGSLPNENYVQIGGESLSAHNFLKRMSSNELIVFAICQIYDLHKEDKSDNEISAIYDLMHKTISDSNLFKREYYLKSSISTEDQTEKFNYLKNFDDILTDQDFIKKLDKEISATNKGLIGLNKRELKKKLKRDENLRFENIKKILVVHPKVFSSKGTIYNPQLDPKKSSELEMLYSEIFKTVKIDSLEIKLLDRSSVNSLKVEEINERSILTSYFNQFLESDGEEIFPIDYQLLNYLQIKHQTNHVMFTQIDHHKWKFNGFQIYAVLFMSFVLPPIGLSILSGMLIRSNDLSLYTIILDLQSGKIVQNQMYQYREPITRLNLSAHVFNIFNQ